MKNQDLKGAIAVKDGGGVHIPATSIPGNFLDTAERIRVLREDARGYEQHLGYRLGGKAVTLARGSFVKTRYLPADSERVLVWGGPGFAWVDREALAHVRETAAIRKGDGDDED